KPVTNVLDNGTYDGQGAYLGGGISADTFTLTTPWTFSVSNVVVVVLAANNSYSVNENGALRIPAPGVLTNDLDVFGTNLAASLASGPAHGSLTLTNNGGFSYAPSNNFVGVDTFTCQPHDG